MDTVADESILAALSFVSATGCVASFSGACRRFLEIARADRIWLPLVDRRWRFGPVPTSAAPLPPGERHVAAASALASALERAAEAPLGRQANAFAFFVGRSRCDSKVATLALQLQAAIAHSPKEVRPGSREPLQPGAVAKVVGLTKQLQLNGSVVVVDGQAQSGRFPVTLLSLRKFSVREENLEFLGQPLSEADVEEKVLALGAEALDELSRLAHHTPAAPEPLRESARRLLAVASERWAVEQWQLLLRDPGRKDLLEEGGLVVSQWGEPQAADVPSARAFLAEMAEAVLSRTSPQAPLRERVEAVNSVLFETHGFCGNADEYYDPRNSFLHSVLHRKRGIPISLSIVWVAVARRVDVPCFLCANMPAHILVRVVASGSGGLQDDLFVDAFGRRVMDFKGLVDFCMDMRFQFQEEFVEQRPASAVYARMLRNLINIYSQQQDVRRLIGTLSQAIVIADSSSAGEVQELQRMRDRMRQRLAAR